MGGGRLGEVCESSEGWRDGGREGWRERGHRWVGLRHVPHVPSGDGDTDLDRLPSCGGSARPFHRCCVRMRMSEGRVGGHLLELGGPRTRLEAGIQGHQGPLSPRIDDHIGMSGPGMPFPSIAGLVMSIAISHNLSHRHRHRHLPAAAVARAGRP